MLERHGIWERIKDIRNNISTVKCMATSGTFIDCGKPPYNAFCCRILNIVLKVIGEGFWMVLNRVFHFAIPVPIVFVFLSYLGFGFFHLTECIYANCSITAMMNDFFVTKKEKKKIIIVTINSFLLSFTNIISFRIWDALSYPQ